MSKHTSVLTKAVLISLNEDLAKAFATVGTKHGLALTLGNTSLTDTNATLKVEIATIGEGGVVMDAARERLTHAIKSKQFPKGLLGHLVTLRGEEMEVTGVNTTYTKVKLVSLDTGKGYLWPVAAALRSLEAAPVAPKKPVAHRAPAKAAKATKAAKVPATSNPFEKGDKVKAIWNGDGKEYKATVVVVREKNCTVVFDDGTRSQVRLDKIRAV